MNAGNAEQLSSDTVTIILSAKMSQEKHVLRTEVQKLGD